MILPVVRPRDTSHPDPRRQGMTLVEILVVLGIVGIVSGAVVLGVGVGDRGVGVESEANRLAERLRLAADEVLVTRRPISLVFDDESYGFVGADGQPLPPADSGMALREVHRLPDSVRMVGLETASPLAVDPDGGTGVAGFGLAGRNARWRVDFDGLNAVVTPVTTEGQR